MNICLRLFHVCRGNHQVCDKRMDGAQLISNTKDGGYYYARKHGAVVQAFYTSCRQVWY